MPFAAAALQPIQLAASEADSELIAGAAQRSRGIKRRARQPCLTVRIIVASPKPVETDTVKTRHGPMPGAIALDHNGPTYFRILYVEVVKSSS